MATLFSSTRFFLWALCFWATAAYGQEMHVRDAGVWQEVQEMHVRVSGVWQEVQEGWVRVSGVWQQFYQASFLVELSAQSYSSTTNGATDRSGVRIATDRDIDEIQTTTPTYIDRGDWLLVGGTASNYEVRCTVNSGTVTGGATCDGSTYLALSTNREWYVEAGSLNTAQISLTIRHATETNDNVTFTVDLSALEI